MPFMPLRNDKTEKAGQTARKGPSSRRRQHEEATVRDVARLAGVSPMTVSRVVNDESNVLPATRKRVNRVIEELGFTPNKAARSLAVASPVRISLLYTNPHNTFLSATLLGMFDRARHSDAYVDIIECREGASVLKTIRRLAEDGVDGIVMGPPLCDSEKALDLIEKMGLPIVVIGAPHDRDNVSSVCIDDELAMYDLSRHVLSLGHRRIAFMIGNPEQSASWLRLDGFRRALHEAGLEPDENLIVQGRFSYRSGAELAGRLLDLDPRPTAILGSNDDMAAGAIAAAHHRDLAVPDELTVCGFDDTMFATTIEPAITTISQPIADFSRTAIQLLEATIRKLRGGRAPVATHTVLEHRLIVRESDGPPPGRQAPC
jgi:LacI family transcriptional regulator